MGIKFIIFTHGNLADGFLDTLELFSGKDERVKTLSLQKEDNIDDIEKIFEVLINSTDTTELIVFTDLFGGSPNNIALKYKFKYNFKVISGTNLALLLEATNNIDSSVTEIIQCIGELKDSTIHIF